ncbi:O-antigen ligase family protein [Clostridium sp.]|uniref:O-antigen ligase family protein n=1 Tax=Clostridium sp. TaxID=1506 RepID=UPI001DE215F2|nr:O-antigen ligase family protein [Clostridium sp.]MBS5938023.1 O-antigen ligase family protein [Clostridium sp.]
MNSIKKICFNKVNLLYCLITIMMLSTIAIISPITTELNIIILIWAAIYFIYDFFNKKTCLKSKYKFFLILYMIIFSIGIILNIKNNPVDNIKTFVYTGFFLFVLYSYDSNKEVVTVQKEIKNINNIVIFISSITSFVAIIMFVFLIEFTFNDIPQGFVYPKSPALWGLYANPNSGGMVATLSIILTIVNIYLCKLYESQKLSMAKKSYYIFNIIIQWLYLILCNSRGAVVSLLSVIMFLIFIKSYNKFITKLNLLKTLIISLIICCIAMFGYNISISVSKNILSYIPTFVENIKEDNTNSGQSGNNEITLEREIKNGHISTGRAEIWSYGLNTLKFSPLFGHGPGNIGLAKQKLYPSDTSKYVITNNMHNGYIQILLSNGVLGLLFFGVFMLLIAKDSLVALFNSKMNIDRTEKIYLILILSPILAIAVNGMFENVILLTQSYITTILWIYMGYLGLYLNNIKNKVK